MAQVKSAFATASDILGGTLNFVFVNPKALFDAVGWTTLTDTATIVVDQSTGLNFTVTLAGNRAIANMTNAKPGSGGYIEIVQDATGARTVTWGSNYKSPGNTPPTLSTAPGAIDLVPYVVRSSGVVRLGGIVKGYLV